MSHTMNSAHIENHCRYSHDSLQCITIVIKAEKQIFIIYVQACSYIFQPIAERFATESLTVKLVCCYHRLPMLLHTIASY